MIPLFDVCKLICKSTVAPGSFHPVQLNHKPGIPIQASLVWQVLKKLDGGHWIGWLIHSKVNMFRETTADSLQPATRILFNPSPELKY